MMMPSILQPQPHPIRFGANLFHHVDRIYDFGPYWIESRWTPDAVERDLKILRSLGAGLVRYHIHPLNYERDKYPGASAEDYRRLMPHFLTTAKSLGLRTHIDLHTDDFANADLSDALERLNELGAQDIDVLQIINEYFYLWNEPKNLDRIEQILIGICDAGFRGQLCFDAGGSVHRRIRKSHPRLAQFMQHVLPMHHYTYGKVWDNLGVGTTIDLVSGRRTVDTSRLTPEERQYYESMFRENFGGLADELHMMEICTAGYPLWSAGELPNRSSRWPELARRLASETNVTWVAHFNFRGKISWREYGYCHCGLLYTFELPRPDATIFRNVAFELMPKEDLYASFRLDVEQTGGDRVRVILSNHSRQPQAGTLKVDGHPPRRVTIPAGGSLRRTFTTALEADRPITHVFAEFIPARPRGEGRCIGWHAIVTPRRPKLVRKVRFPIDNVRYVDDARVIETFLRNHADRLAFVVERPAAGEMELAARLQDAMGEAWGIVPTIHSTMHDAQDALSKKACILIGYPRENGVSRLIERLVPETALPRGAEAVISCHPRLWQRTPRGLPDLNLHWMRSVEITTSPGAMLIWANSFEALQGGVYELLQRIRPPAAHAESFAGKHDREAWSGITLNKPRRFAVRLPAGRYRVSVAVGTRFDPRPFATTCRIAGIARSAATRNGIKRLTWRINHRGGLLVAAFSPNARRAACPAAISIQQEQTLARVFYGYFHDRIRVDMDYANFTQIRSDTVINRSHRRGNWMEIRSAENQDDARSTDYGWIS